MLSPQRFPRSNYSPAISTTIILLSDFVLFVQKYTNYFYTHVPLNSDPKRGS